MHNRRCRPPRLSYRAWRTGNSLGRGCGRGEFPHRRGLGSLRARHDIEFDALALVQGPKPRAFNARVVDEHVPTRVLGDEAIAFLLVKPLYRSTRQGLILLTERTLKSVATHSRRTTKKSRSGNPRPVRSLAVSRRFCTAHTLPTRAKLYQPSLRLSSHEQFCWGCVSAWC